MGVSVKREVSLTASSGGVTLNDLQEFIDAAKDMGVPTGGRLLMRIQKGYSDPRESSPDMVTFTASALAKP